MKVIVSCMGKFHAFQLAEQLERRGCLHKLITSYYSEKRKWLPRIRKDKEKIAPEKVLTNFFPKIIEAGFSKIPGVKRLGNWNYYGVQAFDGWARNHLDSCDVLVAWAGFALHTLRRAKSYGSVTIVERGSTHILFGKKILEEEHERYGVKIIPPDARALEKNLLEYKEADYISVPSRFAKETFIEQGINPVKLIHVPYGVDLSFFKPVPKEDQVFRIVYAGGLTLRKGVHYLLEAFSRLQLKNAELLLVGSASPEFQPFLERFRDFFRWVGPVKYSELYKLYSQGSIFVLPSIEEGLAMVIPQAMACGLPVICTTNTGGSDMIREGVEGYIVPIRSVESLMEKILYLYEHPEERESMGQQSLQRVQEFTWEYYGDRIVASYKNAMDKLSNRKSQASTISEHYARYWDDQAEGKPTVSFNEKLYGVHFAGVISEQDSVLDVGCGACENYQERIRARACSFAGIDISSTAIQEARKRNFNVFQQDFSQPFQFPDQSFDKVICLEVLEHLFDPLHCVREIYRVLKPGGMLVTSVPNSGYFRWRLGMLFRLDLPFSISDFSNPWRSDHLRFFDLESFLKLFKVAGFQIKRIRSSGDASIYDALCIFGAAGRFLAATINAKVPSVFRLGFLGDAWPGLFAPHLIVSVKKL